MNPESRTATYLRAVAILLPTALVSYGAAIFFTPKLEHLSREAGVLPNGADLLINMSHLLVNHWIALAAGCAALVWCLELTSKRWARYRRAIVLCVTIALNSAALIGLASLTTWALVVAPSLMNAR